MRKFHVYCKFFAVTGKRLRDAKLKDHVIEPGLLGEGTVEQVMKAQHNNHLMKIHHAVAEAVNRKKIDTFSNQLREKLNISNLNKFIFLKKLKMLRTDLSHESFGPCMSWA